MTTTTTLAPPPTKTELETETSNEDQLVIVVAEHHIRDGSRGDSRECAVALALKEAGHSNVSVCTADILISSRRYSMPDSLGQWIADFDEGRAVHPERWVIRSAAASAS